jgi:hypothetical protein
LSEGHLVPVQRRILAKIQFPQFFFTHTESSVVFLLNNRKNKNYVL